MSGTLIKLTVPIEAHGEMISTLTLRRPKAKELREMPLRSALKMGDFYDIAAACADIPPSAFDQIDGADVMHIVEVVGGFLDRGTGAPPSS